MEIWKNVKNYEFLYQVSNLGRVKSLSNNRTKKEKILKPWKTNGYLRVHLFKEGISKTKAVHRLVAEAFLEVPSFEAVQVNHKNKNRSDASLDNLEWVTSLQNMNHRSYGVLCAKQIKIEQIRKIMLKHGIVKEEL